ncbi:MAG: PAS domain-containing protein [Deltaproteobacteria bacterium]|nr:MAG: PAS domain-containing protein [Deltaproteobacteria bacterium]
MSERPDAPDVKDDDEAGAERSAEAGDPGFRKLLDKLHLEHNFDLRQYREGSLLRQVRRRMHQIRIADFEAYIRYLDGNRDEYAQLLNVILINVTRFFRDPEAWRLVRERILPVLIEEAATTHSLRLWSAGCSSGEEPYTLAMLVAECLRGSQNDYDVKIYGTDIDEDALATARAGLYRLEALKDVPRELFDGYFVAEGQAYRIRRDVRKWCIFGRHDLTQDSPLTHIDLLVCRNVLIYFDTELQDRLLPRFQYAIRERGYLFLGRAESMLARSRRFVPVDFKWRIFQRVTSPELVGKPALAGDELPPSRASARHARVEATGALRVEGVLEALQSAVMVIDPADTIAVWNPAAELLYDIPADSALGKKFRDLDISYRMEGLRSRVEEVKASLARTRVADVAFPRRSGDILHVALSIAPLFDERRRLSGILVVADDVSGQARLREEINRISEQSATANEELQSTNEELETTNEELQSTNEELETTNEELQSTNEELETTVEELQSINAELATLNAELEKRTAELNRLDQLHQSVVNALEQGLFVLDEAFTVRTWNRAAAAMWGLRANDALNRDFFSLPIGEATAVLRAPAEAVLAKRSRQVVERVPYLQQGNSRKVTVELHPLVAGDAAVGVLAIAASGQARGSDR